MITGHTRVAGVIGSPVRHSLSPALHNAGFASTGADWVYAAFEVAAGDAQHALDAVHALGLGGLSVTMPHKEAVARLVDVLDPAAAALDSVNTVVVDPDGRLVGYSTDGAGFVASLAAHGIVVQDRTVGVVGAGAAARSIVDALARAGVASIVVVNRSIERAEQAVALAAGVARTDVESALADVDIVVNATSVGMGGDELPLDPHVLRPEQVVADIVYHPLETALLRAADAVGARCVDGLGMLVHQAVLQQQLWTGVVPDAGAMRAAAERELMGRELPGRRQ